MKTRKNKVSTRNFILERSRKYVIEQIQQDEG